MVIRPLEWASLVHRLDTPGGMVDLSTQGLEGYDFLGPHHDGDARWVDRTAAAAGLTNILDEIQTAGMKFLLHGRQVDANCDQFDVFVGIYRVAPILPPGGAVGSVVFLFTARTILGENIMSPAAPLFASRRFIVTIAVLAAVFMLPKYEMFVSHMQLALVAILATGWVLGDGIRSDLPAFLSSASPLMDKVKALTSRPRFIAVAGAIGLVLGRSRLGVEVTDFQLQVMTVAVTVWVLSESFRAAVPPAQAPAPRYQVINAAPAWPSQVAVTPSPTPVVVAPAPAPAPSVIPPPPSPQ